MKIISGLKKSLLGFFLMPRPSVPSLAGLAMLAHRHPGTVYQGRSKSFKQNLRKQQKTQRRRAYLRAQRG